jgi:hypothetical protein
MFNLTLFQGRLPTDRQKAHRQRSPISQKSGCTRPVQERIDSKASGCSAGVLGSMRSKWKNGNEGG